MKLTTAQAIVKYLIAQRTMIDGGEVPLFPGVFAIFGHGNVTCLGLALEEARDELPTWRGQNEQGMALAAVGYAKAMRRRQIMVATSSIGPGATNMVTAAGVAHANRLPVLLLSGDTFASRLPDPVLQQVEHFEDPTDHGQRRVQGGQPLLGPHHAPRADHPLAAARGARRCSTRPTAARRSSACRKTCRPRRSTSPTSSSTSSCTTIPRPRADRGQIDARRRVTHGRAAADHRRRGSALLAVPRPSWRRSPSAHNIPVVETVAGKATLLAAHPLNAGPVGVTGCSRRQRAGRRGRRRDRGRHTAAGLHDRLVDAFAGDAAIHRHQHRRVRRRQALAHAGGRRRPRGAARTDRTARRLAGRRGLGRPRRSRDATGDYHDYIDKIADTATDGSGADLCPGDRRRRPRRATDATTCLGAAGGLPGELDNGWRAKGSDDFDCEYGFSCMGYEISGAWGAKMAHARPTR